MTDETVVAPAPETPAAPVVAQDSLLTGASAALDFSAGKPADFPDNFWDAEKNAPNVETMYKEFQNRDKIAKDLRVKLSKGEFVGKAPEDINEYVVELSDEMKPLAVSGDPLFDAARQAAKDAGLPKEAFSKFMQPVIAKLAELKAQAEVAPTAEEMEAARSAEVAKLGATGEKIVGAVGAFIDQLQHSGTFSEAEAAVAKSMANSADAVRVLNKLRMGFGGQDQVPITMSIDDKSSRADIESKMAAAFASGNELEFTKYSGMLSKYS